MVPFKIFNSALFFSTAVIIFIFSIEGISAPKRSPNAILTKKQAFESLKKSGFKWRLTETLPLEAQGKVEQEKSESSFKAEFIMRQLVAKTNPAQYGLDNKISVEVIGVGTTAIGFTYPVYDPIADIKLLGAIAQVDIAKEQSQQFQHELTALMLFQYASMQKLERQLHASKASSERAQMILKLAQTKVRIGAGLSTDIARAKSLVESENIKKLNLQIKLTKSRHELNQLLGLSDEDLTLEELGEESISISSTEKIDFDLAHSQRADYLLAATSNNAAEKASEGLSSNFWPRIAIVGDIGSTDTTILGLPGHYLGGLVGISLTIPLESGGFIDGKRKEMLALKYRSAINLQQTESDLKVQVKESRQQIQAAHEAVAAAGHFVEIVKDEMQLAQKKYQAGSVSTIDVSTAYSNLATALDTQTEALFNCEAAKIQYYRSVGNFEGYFK